MRRNSAERSGSLITTKNRGILKYISLIAILLAVLLIVLDGTIMNVAMVYVARDLNISLQDIQALITFYSLVMGALMLIGGKLADIWGRKRVFMLGVTLFGLGSLVSGLSQSGTQLLIGWSFLEGIGAALMMPASVSMITGMFTGRMQKVAFALWGAMAAVGGTLGPIVGGFITKTWTWRYAFIGQAGLSLLILLGVIFLTNNFEKIKESLDWGGAILSSLGVTSIILGFLKAVDWGWFVPKKPVMFLGIDLNFLGVSFVTWLLGLGIVLFVIWWIYERRAKEPIIDPNLLRMSPFNAFLIIAFLLNVVQASFFFIMPIYFQVYKRFDALQTGITFLPLSFGVLVSSMLSARSTRDDRTDLIRGAIVSLIGVLVTLFIFVGYIPEYALYLAFLLLGLGVGYIGAPLTHIIMNSVPERLVGQASGVNSTLRRVGAALGTALSGSVFFHALFVGLERQGVPVGASRLGAVDKMFPTRFRDVFHDAMYYAFSISLLVVTVASILLFVLIVKVVKGGIIQDGAQSSKVRDTEE